MQTGPVASERIGYSVVAELKAFLNLEYKFKYKKQNAKKKGEVTRGTTPGRGSDSHSRWRMRNTNAVATLDTCRWYGFPGRHPAMRIANKGKEGLRQDNRDKDIKINAALSTLVRHVKGCSPRAPPNLRSQQSHLRSQHSHRTQDLSVTSIPLVFNQRGLANRTFRTNQIIPLDLGSPQNPGPLRCFHHLSLEPMRVGESQV